MLYSFTIRNLWYPPPSADLVAEPQETADEARPADAPFFSPSVSADPTAAARFLLASSSRLTARAHGPADPSCLDQQMRSSPPIR
jgi:hypothetical protein